MHDLLIGLMIYNDGDGFTEITRAVSKHSSPFEVNALSYNATLAAANYEDPSPSGYDFCFINGLPCSFMTIRMFGSNQQISEFYYTLVEGACTDSFSTESWSKLVNTLPTKIQEDYYTCTQFWYDALNDSMGVAMVSSEKLNILHINCYES